MSELDRDLHRNAEATNRLRDVVGRLGQKDLERSLGGGWTVGFALVPPGVLGCAPTLGVAEICTR